MSKLSEYQAALAEVRMKLERVTAQKAELAMAESDLARAVQGWEAIISLERKEAGEIVPPPKPVTEPTEIRVQASDSLQMRDAEEEGENKTQFVREHIRARAAIGTTAGDLKKAAKAVGMKHPPSWPYGPIQRLKKKGEIAKRKGKFYPTATGLSLAG